MHSLDHVDDFTKNLRLKRNKQFFERVRKTEAYYHPHDWELDYQKHLEKLCNKEVKSQKERDVLSTDETSNCFILPDVKMVDDYFKSQVENKNSLEEMKEAALRSDYLL